MKIKINTNRDDLYCLYFKERIERGEKYIEVIEDYLDEEIIKTYAYNCLDMLIEEQLEIHDNDPEIEEDMR